MTPNLTAFDQHRAAHAEHTHRLSAASTLLAYASSPEARTVALAEMRTALDEITSTVCALRASLGME